MGANQSGGQKLRHRFASELPQASGAAAGGGQTSNKSSFGRHQLNKLFRKSLPAQSRCQIKCNSSESQPDYYNPAARGGSNRARRVLDNSNRSAFPDSNQYYVSPDERLVGADCLEPNNGRLHHEPTDMASDREAASRPLGQSHHQRSIQRQVRNQQHQQQQQQPASAIEHHMHMESGMMMTSSTTNKNPQSQQPLNNSNARHLDHYAQHLARQHQQQQLQFRQAQNQDQQAPISVGIARPGKLSGKAQQKSSCSPSSASAASSPTSSSATSSAGGFSSSESLKLRQQQQRRRQVSATNSIPAASQQLGEREGRHQLEWRQQQDQLVAMQLNHSNQRHHRRSHSSGQPLSWSKQQQQAASPMISNDANMLAMAQRHSQGQVEQTSRGQAHRSHELGPHQLISPDQCREQSRLRLMANFNGAAALEHGDDQFYSTNVHLLAVNPISPHEAYSNQSYPVAGNLSAPQQRRQLWPSQQQQFANTSLTSYVVPLNNYSQQYYVNMSQNQQRALNQQSAIYDDLELMQRMSQSASHYSNHQEPRSGQFHHVDYQPAAFLVDQSNTLKSRSKSLGKSSSVNRSPRSRNPLASIFSPESKSKQSPTSHKLGANTMHHFKSHQNLPTSSPARSAAGVNSLKRVKSSPLTTSSYEAMRAIDMYLIRQIARTCMDFEMEQKIDLEIRLRELATQSLLEAETELELLEVEKSLLTSDQRMNCYASQLEQKRKRLSNPSPSTTDSGRGSKTSHWDSSRATAASRPKTTGCEAKPTTMGADVIGANEIGPDGMGQRGEFGSPSGSSFSKGSHQMSPVSSESAHSKQSPPLPTVPTTPTINTTTNSSSGSSSNELDGNGKQQQHSWSSLSRSKHHVIRRPTSAADTLNRRRKSQRQQHLQHLAQMLAKLYNLNYIPSYETKSTISLGELRVPLMWRDVDHFKGRGEYRRFAVFCVAKIGSQIYDSQLISDVDRQMTDLTFDDVILFNNVELDFQLELEVYSCVYLEQFSLSNTPRKLMEKFSNSVGRAMGRRLATRTASVNYIKELEAYDKSYRFAMIASTKLTLADASDSIKTYDLSLISPEAHGRHSTRHSYHQTSNGGARNQQTASALTPNGNGTQQAMINREHQFTSNHNGLLTTTSNQRDLLKNTLPLFGHFCCRLHVRPEILDDAEPGAPAASTTTFGYL